MDRPNILFVTIDTLRADMVRCYTDDAPPTPNIDRLAASGIRFEQAITGGSWTQAAFPVMMTSTYASDYGGCLGPLAPDRPSPIAVLAEYGYGTGAFSTSPLLSRAYGYDRGFAHFAELEPGEADPGLRRMKGGQRLLRNPLTHLLAARVGRRTRPGRVYAPGEKLTEAACHWLDSVDQPFFAWLHYMDVHWPYHREETLTDARAIARAWQDLDHMHRANWNGATMTEAQQAHYVQLYRDAVRYADAEVGRLWDYLARRELLENTIIVLVSDHGEEFLERGHWGHFESNLHDEILRVPLIMYLPWFDQPLIVDRQVGLIDLMPTLLTMGNCPLPQGLEGTDLAPLWEQNGTTAFPDVVISEMWRDHWHIIAVRSERFKYIWNSRHPEQPELYDLCNDPRERENVWSQYKEEARRFQDYVNAHREQAQATAASAGSRPELDEGLKRRLRDLGYME
jgi:arylsulfatase A-like enzyme